MGKLHRADLIDGSLELILSGDDLKQSTSLKGRFSLLPNMVMELIEMSSGRIAEAL